MVAGKAWIKTFENSMNMKCEIMDKKAVFKFGDVVAEASHYVRIPLSLGKIKEDKRQPTLQARFKFGLWYTPCILALILQL